MTDEKDITQIDKFVIVFLIISAPILFLGGSSSIALGIAVFILDWANTLVGIGLILFGIILIVGFIFSVYLPRKRMKDKRTEFSEESKDEPSTEIDNSETEI